MTPGYRSPIVCSELFVCFICLFVSVKPNNNIGQMFSYVKPKQKFSIYEAITNWNPFIGLNHNDYDRQMTGKVYFYDSLKMK